MKPAARNAVALAPTPTPTRVSPLEEVMANQSKLIEEIREQITALQDRLDMVLTPSNPETDVVDGPEDIRGLVGAINRHNFLLQMLSSDIEHIRSRLQL